MSTPTPLPKGKKPKSKKISKKSTKRPQEAKKKSLIGMRSETQWFSNIDENDRAGRIDLALGMVMADMKAMQGEANARKAALTLNTQQMKEHVGRECDEATRRRRECEAEISKTRTALSAITGFVPVPQVSKKVVKPLAVAKSILRRHTPKTKTKEIAPIAPKKSGGITESSKSLVEVVTEAARELQMEKEAGTGGKKMGNAAQRKRSIIRKLSMRDLDAAEAAAKPGYRVKLPATAGPSRAVSVHPSRTTSDHYTTSMDLRGFTNDNISIDMDGRRVLIVAYHPKDKVGHARKLTEIIEIPSTVVLENLKIVRRPNGWITIAEISPEKKVEDKPSL